MTDQLFDVSNKIVVVTGVSGQLGLGYAGAFLERGAKVVGLDCPATRRFLAKSAPGARISAFFCSGFSPLQGWVLIGTAAASARASVAHSHGAERAAQACAPASGCYQF